MNDNTAKRAVLIIAVISSFFVPFITSSVNIALPSIGREFKIDATLLSWVPTAYLLSNAMFLLPFGRTADIYGRKRIFLSGIIIYTAGSLFSALSISGLTLIAGRVTQGLGSSMAFGTAMAILTSVYPREERGRAIGIVTASVYAGLSLGPFLGGFLTQHLGWRSIFLINVPLGLAVITIALWKLKGDWAEARGERLDLLGSTIYAFTLLLIMFGLSRLPAVTGIVLLLAGGVGVFTFFSVEGRKESPVLDVEIFKNNRVFSLSSLAAFIHYSSTYAVTFLMSLYLQYVKGLSAQGAGIVMISQPIMIGIISPIAGRLSDRFDPRMIGSLGLAFTCLGIYPLYFINEETGLTYIVCNLLILGFGIAVFSSPNSNAIMSSVERRHFGVASGTLGTMRVVGSMFSMGVVMMLFSCIMGESRITPELYPLLLKSVKIALAINGTLCLTGMIFSFASARSR